MSTNPEQAKCTAHSKTLILWLVLVAALSTGFGYSLGVRESVSAVLKLSDQHAEERLTMRRHYSRLVGDWKKKYEAQEEAYKKLATKAVSQ